MINSGAQLGHRLWGQANPTDTTARATADTLPPPSITRRARVVIAGAGIAGHAAARALRSEEHTSELQSQ